MAIRGYEGNPELGSLGSNDISSGDVLQTGNWFVIEAINGAATFSQCTMAKGGQKHTVTLEEGAFLWGPCTAINLSSGSVRAYITVFRE